MHGESKDTVSSSHQGDSAVSQQETKEEAQVRGYATRLSVLHLKLSRKAVKLSPWVKQAMRLIPNTLSIPVTMADSEAGKGLPTNPPQPERAASEKLKEPALPQATTPAASLSTTTPSTTTPVAVVESNTTTSDVIRKGRASDEWWA